jgi:hypothetical protein
VRRIEKFANISPRVIAMKRLVNVLQVCFGFAIAGMLLEGVFHAYFSPAPFRVAPAIPVYGPGIGVVLGMCAGWFASDSARQTKKLVGVVVGVLAAAIPALVPLAPYMTYRMYTTTSGGMPDDWSWEVRLIAGGFSVAMLIAGAVLGFLVAQRFVEPWGSGEPRSEPSARRSLLPK